MFPSPARGLGFYYNEPEDVFENFSFPSPTWGLFFYCVLYTCFGISRSFRPLFGAYFLMFGVFTSILGDILGFRPLFGAYFLISITSGQKECEEISFRPLFGAYFLMKEVLGMLLNKKPLFPSPARGLVFISHWTTATARKTT